MAIQKIKNVPYSISSRKRIKDISYRDSANKDIPYSIIRDKRKDMFMEIIPNTELINIKVIQILK